jgi:3-isopropylmalate/(R)-2-methylmalate dehydratase small subunit
MEPFVSLTARAAPLDLVNVDTDRIIPARFLRRPRDEGYGQFLFHDLREAEPDFILDRPQYRDAHILVAAENFGCGSSREGAVWALAGAGFRAWIAPSFGDIFLENSFKNGALAIVLPHDDVAGLRERVHAQPGTEINIDLASQVVSVGPQSWHFDVDPFRKECLLAGIDEIGLTLRYEHAIDDYERHRRIALTNPGD